MRYSIAVVKYHKRKPGPIRIMPDGREICSKTKAGREEYQSRTVQMAIRQLGICALGPHPLIDPTFDHERSRGGGQRDDRITNPDGSWKNAAVCWFCNGNKGSRRYEWRNGKYQPVENWRTIL